MTASPSRLRTVRDYIRWAVSRFHAEHLFFGQGTETAWDEARQLVLGALHLPWEIADSYLDCRLEDDEHAHLRSLLRRRIEERVPTAYLLGQSWYCGLPFFVDARVAIPRSPLAELIEQRFAPWLPHTPSRILELYAGSGCIGIACAYEFLEAEVVLADASPGALEVAGRNIEQHGLEHRMGTVLSAGFEGLPRQRFDLIVASPPWAGAEGCADLPPERRHEPLQPGGGDGLGLVRRLLAGAADHLTDQGVLIIEAGDRRAQVQGLYPDVDFTWLELNQGGAAVFLLAAQQCREHRASFQEGLQG